MPPKKKQEEPKERPILGRFSNNLKVCVWRRLGLLCCSILTTQIGIVGLPNVGKSTLFNLLTKCSIPAENFPFCTIDPNKARVNVPDDRFTWLCNLYKPKNEVPAFLDVVDIAGLVKWVVFVVLFACVAAMVGGGVTQGDERNSTQSSTGVPRKERALAMRF